MKKKAKKAPAKKVATRRRRLLTRIELSKRLEVYPDTISKWERAGLPVAEPGRRGLASLYDLAAVQKWRADREKAAKQNGTFDLQRERARKERAQALVAEQTLAVRAGELIPRAEVVQTWSKELAAIRSKLLAWPATLSDQIVRAAELGGVPAVEKLLQTAVEELLTELSTGKAQAEASTPRARKATPRKKTRTSPKKKPATRKKKARR